MVAVAVAMAVAMALCPSSLSSSAEVAFVDGALLFFPIFFLLGLRMGI